MKSKYLTLLLLCSTMIALAEENPTITEKLKSKYSSVYYDKDDKYYRVKIGDKEGICDINGKEIFAPSKYTDVSFGYQSKDYYTVKIGDKAGICDLNGHEIITPNKYTFIYYDKDDKYYRVKIEDKEGICDINGKEILAPSKYTNVFFGYQSKDYYVVKIGDKTGILDLNGNEIITPNKYTNIYYDKINKYYQVKIGDKAGACDAKGKEIIAPSKYASVNLQGNVWLGELSRNGEKSYDCIYNGKVIYIVQGFWAQSEDMIKIKCDGLFGFINAKTGEMAIEPQYTSADSFKDGVAKVSKDNTSYLISNPRDGKSKMLAEVSTTSGANSDVDLNIPVREHSADETFAFIIANENYNGFTSSYAINDGKTFKEYCLKTLGIPKSNILYVEDATLNNIRAAIKRMKDIADVYDGDVKIIFYYSGQGVSDPKSNTGYLMPIDATIDNVGVTGYSLDLLNTEISGLNAKAAIMLLDAAFNGTTRENKMIASSRGVSVKTKPAHIAGKAIMLTASSSEEAAHGYKEKGHGLFTYFLLKKLQDSKGDCSIKEISDYIIQNVQQKSVIELKQRQTPKIDVSESLKPTINNIKL